MAHDNNIMKKIIGNKKLKRKTKDETKYIDINTNRKEIERLTIPPQVDKWLGEHERNLFDNLTRGLRVPDKELNRAKQSLHLARRICIKKMIAYSYTDSEICMELKITGNQLNRYKKSLFREEIKALKESTVEDQFIAYKHNQMEVIKEIDELIDRFKNSNAINALSTALKTKSEILKDIANRAQDMGFMERKPEELKIINNMDLSEMSTTQLFELLQKQQSLVDKVANGELTNVTEIKQSMKVKAIQ